jgi:hypothetical protein
VAGLVDTAERAGEPVDVRGDVEATRGFVPASRLGLRLEYPSYFGAAEVASA